MKYWLSVAVAACLALAPVAGHAAKAKKHHHSQMHRAARAPGNIFDPSGGNAAAGGNHANSMSGPNSAPENAEGRTSGGGAGSGMGN
jgi:hypothetical protein